MGDVERIEDLGLGDAAGAGLDHQDRLLGAGDDQVELELLERLLVGVDDEVAVELADPDRADVLGDRDLGDRQCRGGAVHREDVVGVDVVHRHRLADQLGLVVPALREQGPDRAVDHPRGQRRLLAGAALASEERAGDLARGVLPLLDVHGQGQEVHVAQVASVAVQRTIVSPARTTTAPLACRASFPVSNEISLPPTSSRDTANVKHAQCVVPFGSPGWRPLALELSFSVATILEHRAFGRLPRSETSAQGINLTGAQHPPLGEERRRTNHTAADA